MYNPRTTYIRIQEIADLQGISLSEINEKCELSKNTISQSANSQEGMKAKKLFDISALLNCSVDYLLGKTDELQTFSGHSIQTGSVGDNSNNNNTSVKIADSIPEELDEMSAELLRKFSKLSFDEKIEVFNYMKKKEA